MAEFLAGARAEILEKTDVLDARVVLEIQNAFGGQAQELPNLIVARIPQMAVMARILDQNFVRADRAACGRKCRRRGGRARPRCGRAAWDAQQSAPTRRHALGTVEITCGVSGESGQKRQAPSERGLSAGSSPVITHERVMGSLRSSMT